MTYQTLKELEKLEANIFESYLYASGYTVKGLRDTFDERRSRILGQLAEKLKISPEKAVEYWHEIASSHKDS